MPLGQTSGSSGATGGAVGHQAPRAQCPEFWTQVIRGICRVAAKRDGYWKRRERVEAKREYRATRWTNLRKKFEANQEAKSATSRRRKHA